MSEAHSDCSDCTADFELDLGLSPEPDTSDELSQPLHRPELGEDRNNLLELPLTTPSITNSPGCAPADDADLRAQLRAQRRMRTVRVDAWAVPASANWTRTRKSTRKLTRSARSADWALPF